MGIDMDKTEIMVTADGSHTLFVPALDEHYHSVNGAVSESMHVFIGHGYRYFQDIREISVLEIGFGTGLNCLLTLLEARRSGIQTRYCTVELFPLPPAITAALNYPGMAGPRADSLFREIHASPWGEWTRLTPEFELLKLQEDFTTCPAAILPMSNLVYFDAFGPEKQPAMWTRELFEKLVERMVPGAVLVTYSARGNVRRDLAGAGLTMERLPGPPGKREMLRGIRKL